jgi:cytochrome c-type biogenesis protein CcmH/NrfF
MFRSFFTALLWSLPLGLLVATIAFPAALIA